MLFDFEELVSRFDAGEDPEKLSLPLDEREGVVVEEV